MDEGAPSSPYAPPAHAGRAPQPRTIWSLTRSGRVVWGLQWAAPVVLVVWVVFGRGILGAPLGWIALLGIVTLGPIMLIAGYIPPLITLGDRDARRSRTTRFGYSIASITLWAIVFVGGLTIPDGGDGELIGSALTVWTGGAISSDASGTITIVLAWIAGAVLLTVSGLAIAGATRSTGEIIAAIPATGRPRAVTVAFWLWWVAVAVQAGFVVLDVVFIAQYGISALTSSWYWTLLDTGILIVAVVFVPRLRRPGRAAPIALSIAAAVFVLETVLTPLYSGAPSVYAIFATVVLIVATVLLLLPASSRYFAGEPADPEDEEPAEDAPRPVDEN